MDKLEIVNYIGVNDYNEFKNRIVNNLKSNNEVIKMLEKSKKTLQIVFARVISIKSNLKNGNHYPVLKNEDREKKYIYVYFISEYGGDIDLSMDMVRTEFTFNGYPGSFLTFSNLHYKSMLIDKVNNFKSALNYSSNFGIVDIKDINEIKIFDNLDNLTNIVEMSDQKVTLTEYVHTVLKFPTTRIYDAEKVDEKVEKVEKDDKKMTKMRKLNLLQEIKELLEGNQ